MEWYQLVAVASMAIAALFYIALFLRLVRLGKPKDYSKASGNVGKGVAYSCTTAMLPGKKESAYLHLPTYVGGMIFHVGTFASFVLLLLSFFAIPYPLWMCYALSTCLGVSAVCGIALLIKRASSKELRPLSSPDDYLSNGFTTLFQLMSALVLVVPALAPYYYLAASLLLLYMPVGKLKHLVYFFAARYQLGFFYGRRNTWPVTETID